LRKGTSINLSLILITDHSISDHLQQRLARSIAGGKESFSGSTALAGQGGPSSMAAAEEQRQRGDASGPRHAEQPCPPARSHQGMELQPICRDAFWLLRGASREFSLNNPGTNSRHRNLRKPVAWVHTERSFSPSHAMS